MTDEKSIPKVWRCLLYGTPACSNGRETPCTWGASGEISPPKNIGCRVGASILRDHVEKVTA